MVTNPTGQLVKIVDVTKTYVTKGRPVVQALENVSLGIGRGELVAVVGPSGCGKTTLLSVLAGLVAPSSGSVEIDGVRVDRPYSDLGIVFQKDLLLEWRTVLSNVMLQAEIRSLDKKELKAKALGLLGQVGLSGFADSFPGELSGGMRQRVSICRALVHDPALLLMDEPFAALDAFTRDDVSLDFLRLVQERQKTVFFITHSIEEAVFLADRVVVMTSRPSRIAEVSTIDLPHPRHLGIRDTTEFVRFTGRIRAIFEKQRELAGESRR